MYTLKASKALNQKLDSAGYVTVEIDGAEYYAVIDSRDKAYVPFVDGNVEVYEKNEYKKA